MNKFRWPPRLAAQLGKVADATLAVRAGVSVKTVVLERRRRGIAAHSEPAPPVEWTPDMIALLGQATDREVAAELGISLSATRYRRTVLGILAFGPTPRQCMDGLWTPSRVALLGTDRDRAIANRLGLSDAQVGYARRKRGIPPFEPRPGTSWTPAMIRLLGKMTDSRVAERLGITAVAARAERRRREIAPVGRWGPRVVRKPALRKLLRLPTKEVVRLSGLSKMTVQRLRRDLGVRPPARSTVWTAAALRALGKIPDQRLASRLGCSRSAVALKRHQLGIRFFAVRRWTPREDDWLRRLPIENVVRRTGRAPDAVLRRRRLLVAQGRW